MEVIIKKENLKLDLLVLIEHKILAVQKSEN